MMQRAGQPAAKEYEFTPTENDVIRDLADKMRFVGLMGVILGTLSLLGAGVALFLGGKVGAGAILAYVIQGVFALLVGLWTRSAAAGFHQIVDTQGRDISNLMSAIGELRRIYTLQRVLFIVVILGLFLALQLTLLMMARGTP